MFFTLSLDVNEFKIGDNEPAIFYCEVTESVFLSRSKKCQNLINRIKRERENFLKTKRCVIWSKFILFKKKYICTTLELFWRKNTLSYFFIEIGV